MRSEAEDEDVKTEDSEEDEESEVSWDMEMNEESDEDSVMPKIWYKRARTRRRMYEAKRQKRTEDGGSCELDDAEKGEHRDGDMQTAGKRKGEDEKKERETKNKKKGGKGSAET